MKRIHIVIGMAFALAALFGCSEKKQQVVVYTPHGKELVRTFALRFEAKNPGVKIHWIDMGSQDILDRLRSEKANPQADLWWGAPSPIFMRAARENLLLPYKPSWAAVVASAHHDPNDYWYATFLTPEVIAFNAKHLSRETAPQDWDDLIQPQWKGRIIIRAPLSSGTMRAIFMAMVLRFYEQTGSPEPGFEWLRKLDANTGAYASDPTLMYIKVARGEGDVTLWNMPDIMLQKNNYNYPFGFVFPKSGTVVVTDCIAVVAGSKHSELAKKFYEFVTTQEALIEQANTYYRIPSRRDIPREKLPEWMNEPYSVLPVNWQLFAEKEDEWMHYWYNNIRNQGN